MSISTLTGIGQYYARKNLSSAPNSALFWLLFLALYEDIPRYHGISLLLTQ